MGGYTQFTDEADFDFMGGGVEGGFQDHFR